MSGSPNRVLAAGAATAETSVSCSAAIPDTGPAGIFRAVDTSNQNAYLGHSADTANLAAGAFVNVVTPNATLNTEKTIIHPLPAGQALTYRLAAAPSSGGFYLDTPGYYFDR